MLHPNVVILVGPTAVGKTALSIDLAQQFQGEIINADPNTFYRGLDIGTAKPTVSERAQLPHHLFDVVTPDETVTLGDFQKLALAKIEAVLGRGKVPFVVGGSGLYMRALTEGYQVPEVAPQTEFRARLEAEAAAYGKARIYARLRAVDPAAAAQIDYRNLRRVIRALEIIEVTGKPFSAQRTANPPPYRFVWVGLTRSRESLYRRIDQRIELMLGQGFKAEVERLLTEGYAPRLPALGAIGYRQMAAHLAGELTLEEVIALMQKRTRKLVRQQQTWFRANDERIFWVEMSQSDAPSRVQRHLAEQLAKKKLQSTS